MERKAFEMTQEQFQTLIGSMKGTPVMMVGEVDLGRSAQENANDAWKALGQELGFQWDTVDPIPGKAAWHFTAEILPPPKPKLPTPIEVLKDLAYQIKDSGYVDKHGHPMEMNKAYQTMLKVLEEA
jgi:hypothetical protein